jgi:hypothetical protein
MPVSDFHQIPQVLDVIEQFKPKSILDVGIGFGKWGVLIREITDIYQGDYAKNHWKIKIDGIDIFPNYQNPIWSFVYDNVIIEDIFLYVDKMNNYDAVVMCDVLEHFDKEKGRSLIEKLLTKTQCLIITTPYYWLEQGAVFGNDAETHKSLWNPSDFKMYHSFTKKIGFTFIAVLTNSKPDLNMAKLKKRTLGKRALDRIKRVIKSNFL